MSGAIVQGSAREILAAAQKVLASAVKLDLSEEDMTTEQKAETAAALMVCANIFRTYASDFRRSAA